MPRPKREGVESVGLRLAGNATHKLKVVAVERKVTFSGLVEEALALWWEQQPERETKGPLFTDDTPTPVATKESAPKKTTAQETATARPLAKPPKKKVR